MHISKNTNQNTTETKFLDFLYRNFLKNLNLESSKDNSAIIKASFIYENIIIFDFDVKLVIEASTPFSTPRFSQKAL